MALIDEKRRLEVLSQGGNPYAVKGLRETKEKFAAGQERTNQERESRYNQIAERLMSEQEYLAVKEEEADRVKAYEKKAIQELSREVVEARRAEYLMQKTKSGLPLIDPTSKKAQIFPSKEVLVETATFGLGLGDVEQALIDRVEQGIKVDPILRVKPEALHTSTRVLLDNELIEPDAMHLTVKPPRVDKPAAEPVQIEVTADDLPQQPHAVPELPGLWVQQEEARKLGPGNLSKFEERMQAEAHERHKNSLCKEQVVWGKVYEGPGFLCDPPVLRFVDFEPNRVYKRKVVITNVSYTFNYFKLAELDDTVKNFFDVTFKPPGRMSAGLTCDVWLTFEPKLNEDISTVVAFLGETGPFELAVECTVPKVELYFDPQAVLDLGTVEMDQERTQQLCITNRGNKATKYSVHVLDCTAVSDDGREFNAFGEDVVTFQKSGSIPAATVHRDSGGNVIDDYTKGRDPSKTYIPFTFKPNCGGEVNVSVEIRFGKDGKDLAPLKLTIAATGKLVPVFVELPSMAARPHLMQLDDMLKDHRDVSLPRIDMECCTAAHFFRDLVVLHNRSNNALKCEFRVPTAMQNLVEFHPDMCYVQANTEFGVQLKLTPTYETLERARSAGLILGEVSENQTFLVKVPVSVIVPERMPVKFCIVARITQPEIAISHSSIDFGACSVAEAVKVPVTLSNMSCLPQEIAFIKLPHEVSVEEKDLAGFFSLNPYPDSVTCDLLFQPSAAKVYEFEVQLQSKLNHVSKIKCIGEGKAPPLLFETPVIKFAACAQNQLVSHTVLLKNETKKSQQFEFGIPEDWPVTVYPSRGVLKPNENIRIRVDFVAEEEVVEAAEPVEQQPEPTEEAEAEAADTAEGTEDETGDEEDEDESESSEAVEEETKPKDRWETFTIPCFVRGYDSKCIYLEAQTCVFPSVLEVQCDGVDKYGTLALQFGELALGQARSQKIRLVNKHPTERCVVSVGSTLSHGPFAVQAAPRELPPGGFCDIPVRFRPLEASRFMERLQVFSNLANLSVCLRGDGVIPSLRLEPEYLQQDSEDQRGVVFNVGDVLQGERVVSSFSVVNASDQFELEYTIGRSITAHPNHSSRVPFDCIPSCATIERNGRQQVDVAFTPDHQSWRFRETIVVAIAGQKPKPISLEGRSWLRSMFLAGFDVPTDQVDDPFADEIQPELEEEQHVVLTMGVPGEVKELFVGNIEAMDKSKKNDKGEVELVLPADAASLGFEVEPTKLSLAPGDMNSKVSIKFDPKADQIEEGGLLKGEWVEIDVKCNMKGGFVPAGSPALFVYHVKVRGLVQ
eukprot:TRINITY_DN10537_c0_g1_i1.p1 TRINITY_DN10537_c0_g1~~TRINITY_DN10537_c0_g1_i1.p1  ORF type:complete len:1296 (-),score=422.09 TRINITY_DN10537_c0_g1_i1:6-3893(-)